MNMIALLHRLPIPNLKHYCAFSIVLLAIVIVYAQKVLYNITNDRYTVNEQFNSTYIQANGYVYTLFKAILNEPWCLWVLINCGYCALLLFSKTVQGMIFGSLRVVEYQHIKDQFWNFIFLKFIFIFGVLNLENFNEVGIWCTWFSTIGFLAIHSQICKDRFEYLSFSSTTPLWNHIKVIALLNCIICVCMLLLCVSLVAGFHVGLSIGLFMFAESLALTTRTLYVVAKYAIHLWDINITTQWENKATISYYVDFIFEIAVVIIEFLHYVHMLLYGNFFLSMASIVICMELRRLFFDIKKRIKRHSNYLRVIEKMEKRFTWASRDDLEEIDKCAVCWEKLDKGRRLPCGHIFHHNCLRSWLEQDTSCPTCRLSLQDEKDNLQRQQQNAHLQPQPQQPPQQLIQQQQQQPQQQLQQPTTVAALVATDDQTQQQQPQQQDIRRLQTNFFHFDGSRYVSWLPSFSVEVTHNLGNNLPAFLRQNIDENRLNAMAQQVSQVFPHITLATILDDLRQTNSTELTIENILQDRVAQNPVTFFTDSDETDYDDTNEESDTANRISELSDSRAIGQNEPEESTVSSALLKRKRELIEASKQRFLSKTNTDASTSSSVTDSNGQSTSTASIRLRNPQNLNENNS